MAYLERWAAAGFDAGGTQVYSNAGSIIGPSDNGLAFATSSSNGATMKMRAVFQAVPEFATATDAEIALFCYVRGYVDNASNFESLITYDWKIGSHTETDTHTSLNTNPNTQTYTHGASLIFVPPSLFAGNPLIEVTFTLTKASRKAGTSYVDAVRINANYEPGAPPGDYEGGVWNGSAWVRPKVWNGTTWAEPKIWNGNRWVQL